MKLEIQFEIDDQHTGEPREVVVEVEYHPGRQASPCSDHDAAEFSDPGESSEAFIVKASYSDGDPVEASLVETNTFHDYVQRAADECYRKGEI